VKATLLSGLLALLRPVTEEVQHHQIAEGDAVVWMSDLFRFKLFRKDKFSPAFTLTNTGSFLTT